MINQALDSLRPGARWILEGYELSGLDWLDDEIERPSDAEILTEVKRLEREAAANAYIDARKAAYAEEADALFFQEQRGEVPIGTWQARIDDIKARFPKAEEGAEGETAERPQA